VIKVFSAKNAVWLAALAVVLSAALIAPALAVQSSLVIAGSTSYVPEETSSKDIDESSASTAGTASPSPLNLSSPSDVAETSTVLTDRPAVRPSPTSVATLSPTPVVTAPVPQQTLAPTPAPTQAPVIQQPAATPVVGTVDVSQVAPGDGIGEAVLQWSSIPGATEYRIYKTGTIRPSWRLFYIYPSSITSITIFDQPGSIAIYKIMAVVNFKENLIGEAIYEPTN
jgi:hypothetical protein